MFSQRREETVFEDDAKGKRKTLQPEGAIQGQWSATVEEQGWRRCADEVSECATGMMTSKDFLQCISTQTYIRVPRCIFPRHGG